MQTSQLGRTPELQFAYNSARHEATEYSPAYLNFGHELIAPVNRAAARPGLSPPDTTRRHLEEAFELIRISMVRAFPPSTTVLRPPPPFVEVKNREVDMEA